MGQLSGKANSKIMLHDGSKLVKADLGDESKSKRPTTAVVNRSGPNVNKVRLASNSIL